MILKKPYAFFIKIFKPMHLLLSFLLIYNIYITNGALKFFNNYIYSNENVVGQVLKEIYAPMSIFVIPIILILFCLIFLGIMFNKKKPYIFYLISIFVFLIVIVINLYVANFLSLMEESIVAIKIVKFNHDLVLINMVIEIVYIVLFIIRGLGLNLQKFDFNSDISKFNISESDKEEFEFSINIDLDMAKRNHNKKIRQLKYLYKENKFIINILSIFIFIILLFSSLYPVFKNLNRNDEGKLYNMSNFNLKVNKTFIFDETFNGDELVDNFLIVVDTSLQSNKKNQSLSLNNFKIKVGEVMFGVSSKYSKDLVDVGTTYSGDVISQDEKKYIFTFEIPKKYIKSDFTLIYYDNATKNEINLKANNYRGEKAQLTSKMGEILEFKNTLSNISFTINNMEINKKFLIKYNYCISTNDCLMSKEYIKPSIDENFDKCVLKLNVDYENKSDLNINSFYQLLSQFAIIQYKINNVWYAQNGSFEEIKSKRVNSKNNVYIGVNIKLLEAESIRLVFNVRGTNHIYILK